LIAACRQGEEAAWEALVQRYQRLIYSIPRRAGLGEDLAAEVFQQVFAKLVEHLDRIEQPARIQAWLVTLARRESLRLLRREPRPAPVRDDADDEDAGREDPVDQAPLADETLARMEAQQRVHQAVLSLDERCRELLILLFYRAEPPSYAEVAAALGTSEGSIGPTRARCLQKLQRLLE
jgi:RNA polymerase sigma factor (sigma-70 family)